MELSLVDNEAVYSVSLETGMFNVNGLKLGFDEVKEGDKFRLIYFKRVRQNMGSFGADSSIRITYNIGYQTTKKGKNIKRYLMISDNDIRFNCGGK